VGPAGKTPPGDPEHDSIRWGRDQWAAKYGQQHATAMEAFSSLLRTREVLVDSIDRQLAKLDLSWIDYDLLSVIDIIGGGAMALGKIRFYVRRFILHQTSITNVVGRLTDRGIVTTKPDEEDGRVTLVELTPLGRRRLRRAHTILAQNEFSLHALSEKQQRSLIELLYAVRLSNDDVHPMPDERR
jgi:DNA-binding MarR family transcriptional regulator